jgi:hypothetical protein
LSGRASHELCRHDRVWGRWMGRDASRERFAGAGRSGEGARSPARGDEPLRACLGRRAGSSGSAERAQIGATKPTEGPLRPGLGGVLQEIAVLHARLERARRRARRSDSRAARGSIVVYGRMQSPSGPGAVGTTKSRFGRDERAPAVEHRRSHFAFRGAARSIRARTNSFPSSHSEIGVRRGLRAAIAIRRDVRASVGT